MKRIFFYILILFSVLMTVACSKGGVPLEDDPLHEFNPQDTTFPIIEIYKPLNNQVFVNGETIYVEGKVTDTGLYQGSIRIVNDVNGSLIKEQLYEIHGLKLYNFNFAYKTAVTTGSDYSVTVKFEDHGLNETTKTVKIKVNF